MPTFMKSSETQRLVKRAVDKTSRSGLRQTRDSLAKGLMPLLSGWNGEADRKHLISQAVEAVRAAHEADIAAIKLNRSDMDSHVASIRASDNEPLGSRRNLFLIGWLEKSVRTSVEITDENEPCFWVRTRPKPHKMAEASRNWATFFGVAALDLMLHAGGMKEDGKTGIIMSALVVGVAAVVVRKMHDAVALCKRFTVPEFDRRITRISGIVESALKRVEQELGGPGTQA